MGIQGLLPLMKGAETTVSLSRLQDTVAAVDTNGWIHRACYSCADRIYMGEPTEMFIHYCLNFCKILEKHRITPILVFDGQSLPAKSETKLARQKRKQEKREEIEVLLRKGRESEARWLMRQCVDVTFEMCRQVIERCRQKQIDCLVAPFEADAQITYLVNNNLADYAITEDSDLLAFGCKRALYKLDREFERGKMIDMSHLNRCFKNLNLRKFQLMCILSGCDYVSNIPGIGIGRARKFFESFIEDPTAENMHVILQKLPSVLKMNGKINVTNDYIEDFIRASNTFDHQIVYSPQFDRLVYLNPLKQNIDPNELKLYGGNFFSNGEEKLDNNLKFVTNYVLGNVCPKTLSILDSFIPQSLTIWHSPEFNERIRSQMSNRNLELIIQNGDKKEEKRISKISPSKVKSPKLKNNGNEIIDSGKSEKNENDTNRKTKTSIQRRYTRNVFRKRTVVDDGIVKKSKYFLHEKIDEQTDNSDAESYLPQPKKSRPESLQISTEELNQSFSSIEEEEVRTLQLLNSCQIDKPIAKSSYRQSYSLSSTQTSQSTSTSNSPTELQMSSSDLFNKLITLSNAPDRNVSKKNTRTKSSSSETKITATDIRKFFPKISP